MVSTPDELRAWLRLCLTPGIGNTTARSLLQAFGLPQTIFSASAGELQHVVSPSQSQALLQIPSGLDMLCEDTWKWLSASPIGGVQRRLLTLADAEYPTAPYWPPATRPACSTRWAKRSIWRAWVNPLWRRQLRWPWWAAATRHRRACKTPTISL